MGSMVGVIKVAAKRIGIPLEEYLSHTDNKEKWCRIGKHWALLSEFGRSLDRGSGLEASCKKCRNGKYIHKQRTYEHTRKGMHPPLETILKMRISQKGNKNSVGKVWSQESLKRFERFS